MKIAVIGSRGLNIDISEFIPDSVTEIVSGGARGIDTCAKKYAIEKNISYIEFLPDYKKYKKGAPLKRNLQIVRYVDFVVAFWDGKSKGTKFTIDKCRDIEKSCIIIIKD